MEKTPIRQYISDYMDIYLKIKNYYGKIKQQEKECKLESEECNLDKFILGKLSEREDKIIEGLYRDYIRPKVKSFKNIKILVHLLERHFLIFYEEIDDLDIKMIKTRLETAMSKIFVLERKKIKALEENKKDDDVLYLVYEEDEIGNLTLDEIYDAYKTCFFINNDANLHHLLFLQREIDETKVSRIRELLIENKFIFISMNKYFEKLIMSGNKKFNFDFNFDEESNILKDKLKKVKYLVGLNIFYKGYSDILAFMYEKEVLDEKELEASLITKKCSLQSALLMLNEAEILKLKKNVEMDIQNDIELLTDFNKAVTIINSAFRTRKIDKGFSRNLRKI